MEEKTSESSQNKTVWWILGVLVSILLIVAGIANAMMENRVRNLETYGSAAIRERVAKLEIEYQHMQIKLEAIEAGQQTILSAISQLRDDFRDHDRNPNSRTSSKRQAENR